MSDRGLRATYVRPIVRIVKVEPEERLMVCAKVSINQEGCRKFGTSQS